MKRVPEQGSPKGGSNVSTCLSATLDNQHSKQMKTHAYTDRAEREKGEQRESERRNGGKMKVCALFGSGKSELVFDINAVIVILLVWLASQTLFGTVCSPACCCLASFSIASALPRIGTVDSC